MLLMILAGALARPTAAQEAPPPADPDGPALFEEPGLLTAALDLADRLVTRGDGQKKDGYYTKVGGMISGAGWISGGPGVHRRLFGDRAFVDAYATVSWRSYLKADAVFEFPLLAEGKLAAGVEAAWQDSTQVNYFGLGPDSLEELRSQYRLQTMNVVGYARYRPQRWLALTSRFGWLDEPSISSATGFFDPDYLDAQATFPNDPAMTLADQPSFLHGDIGIVADNRDHNDHPTRGGLYRASAGAYKADQQHFSFQRYEVEGLQAIPFFDRRWFLLVRGWGVFTHAAPTQEVPFYLMPALGGANSLRGYSNYRFHDRHSLLTGAESRWPIFAHMDAAVFVDAGTVAARVTDLGLDKWVYGFAARIHVHDATAARLDVSHTEEGWQMVFRSSDPFNLSRLKRWIAAVPFGA
jgi:hypothetical protein